MTVASVEDTLEVVCSRMVKLVADALITDCATKPYDLIALPVRGLSDVVHHEALRSLATSPVTQGGMPGAERLRDSATLQTMLKQQQVCVACTFRWQSHRVLQASGRKFAAICASPAVVFQAQGLLDGKKGTCHPAFVDKLADSR